jgi:biotin carboxyl carrier protein
MAEVGNGGTDEPAADAPVDPRAVRVEVAPSLPVPDAGPWTIEPQPDEADPSNDSRIVEGILDRPARDGTRRHEVVVDGWRFLLDVGSEHSARLRAKARRGREDAGHGGPLEVRAIIPGRVVAVSVAEGDEVEVGQQLLVIEAMKMQNELRSPRAGRVERLAVGSGQTVELGALLLVIQ